MIHSASRVKQDCQEMPRHFGIDNFFDTGFLTFLTILTFLTLRQCI